MSSFRSQFVDEDEGEDDGAPPDCFGDEDYYGPEDRECKRCEFRVACSSNIRKEKKAAVSRRIRNRANATTRTRKSRTSVQRRQQSEETGVVVSRDVGSYIEVESAEEDTFASAVMHNASLNAAQGIADTISQAISHIPRKRYNMFHSLKTRQKQ